MVEKKNKVYQYILRAVKDLLWAPKLIDYITPLCVKYWDTWNNFTIVPNRGAP